MKKLHCLECGKKTNHEDRQLKSTYWDRRGKPHEQIIVVPCCTECGRPAP